MSGRLIHDEGSEGSAGTDSEPAFAASLRLGPASFDEPPPSPLLGLHSDRFRLPGSTMFPGSLPQFTSSPALGFSSLASGEEGEDAPDVVLASLRSWGSSARRRAGMGPPSLAQASRARVYISNVNGIPPLIPTRRQASSRVGVEPAPPALLVEPSVSSVSSGASEAECPVCLMIFSVPVCLPCGHAFCRQCIAMVHASRGQERCPCPMCRAPFRMDDLTSAQRQEMAAEAAENGLSEEALASIRDARRELDLLHFRGTFVNRRVKIGTVVFLLLMPVVVVLLVWAGLISPAYLGYFVGLHLILAWTSPTLMQGPAIRRLRHRFPFLAEDTSKVIFHAVIHTAELLACLVLDLGMNVNPVWTFLAITIASCYSIVVLVAVAWCFTWGWTFDPIAAETARSAALSRSTTTTSMGGGEEVEEGQSVGSGNGNGNGNGNVNGNGNGNGNGGDETSRPDDLMSVSNLSTLARALQFLGSPAVLAGLVTNGMLMSAGAGPRWNVRSVAASSGAVRAGVAIGFGWILWVSGGSRVVRLPVHALCVTVSIASVLGALIPFRPISMVMFFLDLASIFVGISFLSRRR